MTATLKKFCLQTLPFTEEELALIDIYFEPKTIKKKDLYLEEGKVCNLLAFIVKGCIRHFHIKDGEEKTCAISFENEWVTDFQSFSFQTLGQMNFQAMEETHLLIINKENLEKLYKICPKYETFGRLMVEKIVHKSTQMTMSLTAQKPEERYLELLELQPDIFRRIPQKYIANLIGVGAESMSRIRKRTLRKN